ncbi:protein of unknown function [Paraburkholderia dioscoreae]|uniref:Uncharacterized protein n=1 Tax=Paraburkholderia dioscoreae TaxID=2604047 RepID=A0A5Q4ZRV5_9BURK|nr:protein of unknown function [Paraburkholderia dioscoreae]
MKQGIACVCARLVSALGDRYHRAYLNAESQPPPASGGKVRCVSLPPFIARGIPVPPPFG